MASRLLGPLIAIAIMVGVAIVLLLNLEPSPSTSRTGRPSPTPRPPAPGGAVVAAGGFREWPIGEEERAHLLIKAVWLPSVHMAGMPSAPDPRVVHLEADIQATAENPQGFALHGFVPYLTVAYRIEPDSGGETITGTMIPMVARDGLHYGASVMMPGPGSYTLTYHIDPPSSNGLGRHDDPLTGVAPWWEPFEVSFPWKFDGPPPPPTTSNNGETSGGAGN